MDGNWSKWNDYSECSVKCGAGERIRNRTCSNPSPRHGGLSCPGSDTEISKCQRQTCDYGSYYMAIVRTLKEILPSINLYFSFQSPQVISIQSSIILSHQNKSKIILSRDTLLTRAFLQVPSLLCRQLTSE